VFVPVGLCLTFHERLTVQLETINQLIKKVVLISEAMGKSIEISDSYQRLSMNVTGKRL